MDISSELLVYLCSLDLHRSGVGNFEVDHRTMYLIFHLSANRYGWILFVLETSLVARIDSIMHLSHFKLTSMDDGDALPDRDLPSLGVIVASCGIETERDMPLDIIFV